MRDIDRIRSERDILLQTILSMGSVTSIDRCPEHDVGCCLTIHLAMPSSKAPPPPPKRKAPEDDEEYTPELAAALSERFGQIIDIARDADNGGWIGMTEDSSVMVTGETIAEVTEKIANELG